MSAAPLLVLGCGYVGSRLALAARAAGRTVRVGSRGTGKIAHLAEKGIEVKYFDASMPKQLTAMFSGLHGATVVYSIPPASSGPPGAAVRNALQAAYGVGANAFIYFSSSGMYGRLPDDEVWIDEDSEVIHDDPPMKGVQTDELVITQNQFDRLRTIVLRLAPVYGPGRGVRERLRKGDYTLLDDGAHAISRIHVDDVVKVVFAAEDRAETRTLLLVADDEPTTQRDYATWLSERMNVTMPGSRALGDAGSKQAHRNRKIRNTRLKETLGLTLTYPTFREGEVAIEEELARE